MDLHYRTYGDAHPGAPVVILHGLLGSGGNWHSFAARLSERRRVVVPDLRNHGRSPHAPGVGYPEMAADVLRLMDTLGLDEAALVGHSMGGKVAMEAALAAPARAERLLVVDIAPRAYPALHTAEIGALRAVDPAAYTRRADVDAALAPSLPDAAVRRFLLKNLAARPDGAFYWQPNLDALDQEYPRIAEALAGGRLYAGPTLVLRGERSAYVQPGDEALLRALFPHAVLATVPGAGHWVHAEAPEAFARQALPFLLG